MRSSHFMRGRGAVAAAAVCAVCAGTAVVAQQSTPPGTANFIVFIRSVPVGSEQISLEQSAAGWTISSNGRIGAPVNLVSRKVEVRYDQAWKPLELTIDATTGGQLTTLHTTVNGTTASSEMISAGTRTEKSDTIDASAILLPNLFFGPYEALATRLRSASGGSVLSAYIVPLGSMTVAVGESTAEKIDTVGGVVEARRTPITMTMATAPALAAEIWSDASGRLLRVSVPAQALEVVREDVASVSSRRVTVSRPGDEQVRVQANGFSLAATVSKPVNTAVPRLPAVILVGGSGATDRDETAFGIPIFGQLAGALADAGLLVLRYDKRGIGQSGGRPEAATLADYADDLRAAVKNVSDRKDVDRRRIAVIGHSEGGAVSMIAASKDDRIAAVALLATPGLTGAEVNLAQVTHGLERSSRTAEEQQAALDLQKRIQKAVLTGEGWEGISANLRQQADTAWFQSFLAFDPARLVRDIDQPLLVVQGLLDTQVEPVNADRLEALARGRKKGSVDVVRLPGINHLLVPAKTGEVDEYGMLGDRRVSPAVTEAVVGWLKKIFRM